MSTEHPAPIRNVLRRAGMSQESDLTPQELANAWKAVELCKNKDVRQISQQRIYTTIRPWYAPGQVS